MCGWVTVVHSQEKNWEVANAREADFKKEDVSELSFLVLHSSYDRHLQHCNKRINHSEENYYAIVSNIRAIDLNSQIHCH